MAKRAIERFSEEEMAEIMKKEEYVGRSPEYAAAVEVYRRSMESFRKEILSNVGDYDVLVGHGSKGEGFLKDARDAIEEGMACAKEEGIHPAMATLDFFKGNDFEADFRESYESDDFVRGVYDYSTDLMGVFIAVNSTVEGYDELEAATPYLAGLASNQHAPVDIVDDAKRWLDEYDSFLDANGMMDEIEEERAEWESNLDGFESCVRDSMELEEGDFPSYSYEFDYSEAMDGFEAAEAVSEEMEQRMAASVAAYNAQHPVRFALSGVAAAIASLREIPAEMKNNRDFARSMGLDTRTALGRAADNIGAMAMGVNKSVANNAMAAVEKVGNIYKAAVETTYNTWQKAKSAMAKGVASAVKGYDIGMEYLTGGAWSKYCSKTSENRRNADYDGMSKFNKIMNKIGFSTNSLHDKLIGVTPEEHWKSVKQSVWGKQENDKFFVGSKEDPRQVKGKYGVVSPQEISDAKAAYVNEKFHEKLDAAKEKVSNAAEKVGIFMETAKGKVVGLVESGKQSVIDAKYAVLDAGKRAASRVSDGFEAAKEKTLEAGHAVVDTAKKAGTKVADTAKAAGTAVKDGATAAVDWVKGMPGRAEARAEAIAETMRTYAGMAAEKAVEGYTALKIGGLTLAKKTVDKVAAVERFMERSNNAAVEKANAAMEKANEATVKAEERIAQAEQTIQDVKDNAPMRRMFSFTEQEMADFRVAAANAAKGTATPNQKAYMKIMKAKAEDGIRKEARHSVIDKIVYNMKNAGVNLEARASILDAKLDESMAIDEYISKSNSAERHERAAERHGKAAKTMEGASGSLQAKIDALKGNEVVANEEVKVEPEEDALSMMNSDKSFDEPSMDGDFIEEPVSEAMDGFDFEEC